LCALRRVLRGLYCCSRCFRRVSTPIRRPLLATFPLEMRQKVTFTVYMPCIYASLLCTPLDTPLGTPPCRTADMPISARIPVGNPVINGHCSSALDALRPNSLLRAVISHGNHRCTFCPVKKYQKPGQPSRSIF